MTHLSERHTPGQPHLDIVSESGAEPEIARSELNHSVGQIQLLQARLSMRKHCFQLVAGVLGAGDADQFNLAELVESQDPTRVTPVRSCLRAVAGSPRRIRI